MDEKRTSTVESKPIMHGARYEPRTIVEQHAVRRPVIEGQTIPQIDDAVGVDGAIDLDREYLR